MYTKFFSRFFRNFMIFVKFIDVKEKKLLLFGIYFQIEKKAFFKCYQMKETIDYYSLEIYLPIKW